MTRRLTLLLLCLTAATTALAQRTLSCTFDDSVSTWRTARGHAALVAQGAHSGRALRLAPHSEVAFDLTLQPASTYRLVVWMRTESGADDMTMQLEGLGSQNFSVTNARAAWTRFERTFHVAAGQSQATLLFSFDNSQGNTSAWVDNLSIERMGHYDETLAEGIPQAAPRRVKTDLGLTMQPDSAVAWMLDAKLGLFIHWGLYAGPAKGEWYMQNEGVKPEEYRKLAYAEADSFYFDASDFDPSRWTDLAKSMGARYMCLTTQHHDGYALFESQYPATFTSMQTHHRDFVKEYVEACRQAGLRVGFYKTLINWRYPGYYDVTGTDCKPNRFGYTTDSTHRENARLMKEELYCQTRELMTRYGKIDLLFWDGGWLAQQGTDADAAYFWESGKYLDSSNLWPVGSDYQDMDDRTGRPLGLMGMVRKYQPDILANSRSGWVGDYDNEEGGGPVSGEIRSGVVEKCFTLTPGWGYTKKAENAANVMPLNRIKRLFADCIVRNMCCLINVGPDRHGHVPEATTQRLHEFGQWVEAASEAIYGTRGGPWQPVDGQYGFCYKGNVIYLYLLGGYTSDTFSLPALNKGMKVRRAYDVISRQRIKTAQKGTQVTLTGIQPAKDDISVIAVELNQPVR